MPIRVGRALLTIVSLFTSAGAYIADWNETHIYNPTWPGHAKFHNGQTMSTGLLLGASTLWYLYGPAPAVPSGPGVMSAETKSALAAAVKAAAKADLRTAALLASLYWVTQASAWFYPGTTGVDPLPGKEHVRQDPYIQAKLEVVMLTLTAVGWWMENRAIEAA